MGKHRRTYRCPFGSKKMPQRPHRRPTNCCYSMCYRSCLCWLLSLICPFGRVSPGPATDYPARGVLRDGPPSQEQTTLAPRARRAHNPRRWIAALNCPRHRQQAGPACSDRSARHARQMELGCSQLGASLPRSVHTATCNSRRLVCRTQCLISAPSIFLDISGPC